MHKLTKLNIRRIQVSSKHVTYAAHAKLSGSSNHPHGRRKRWGQSPPCIFEKFSKTKKVVFQLSIGKKQMLSLFAHP